MPFRDWCEFCVQAKARQNYQPKQAERRNVIQLDVGFIASGELNAPILLVIDGPTGCSSALMWPTKTFHETMVRCVDRVLALRTQR